MCLETQLKFPILSDNCWQKNEMYLKIVWIFIWPKRMLGNQLNWEIRLQ